MKIFSFLLIAFFPILSLNAHNPQVSTIALVQSKENKWNLIISASLSAFQYELKNTNPNLNLDSLNADNFQRLIVKHLKEKIKIEANQIVGTLANGRVILGHQTDINFEVANIPSDLSSLDIEHLGFGTLKDHFCILKVITQKNESGNFILQNANNHAISLEIKNNSFKQTQRTNPSKLLIFSIILILSTFAVGIVHSISKKTKTT